MASIVMEAIVRAPAETVWRAVSNFGEAHRVFLGVLSDCRLESETTRIVTFANGLVVSERMIGVDSERRRIAYTVVSGGFEHHGASMQVSGRDDGACRFVWTCDVLPDSAVERICPLMNAGIAALKQRFAEGS